MSDTIAAVATGTGAPSGINIIRISGPQATATVQKIFRAKSLVEGFTHAEPNRMYLGTVSGNDICERAFCVYYKAPKSYTGEDVAEIHCHGGIAVTREVLALVLENGARMAEAGEFTKRAFLNGKLSLAAAEGVADMIRAETRGQVKNAYQLMSGKLTEGIERAEKYLIDAAASLEAKMDYPEELEEDVKVSARKSIDDALSETERLLKNAKKSKIIKNGIDIAIIGSPNVGKSSLLNAILKEDRAIVTPIAGTTRDVIKESVEYEGYKLNFLDTAGIRESDDDIERAGIERSRRAIETADVILYVVDLSTPPEEDPAFPEGANVLCVANKSDLVRYEKPGIRVCAATGENVDELLKRVLDLVGGADMVSDGVVTDERHLSALRECRDHLLSAQENYDVAPTECTVIDLYAAAEALGKITGRTASQEVVDAIFKKFCVGK